MGSGGQVLGLKGWFLHFFGMYGSDYATDDVPNYGVKVPVHLFNQYTNQEKDLQISCNWLSVSKVDKNTYKPDLGLLITEAREKKQEE